MQISKNQTQELFCQKYWKRVLSGNTKTVSRLSHSSNLADINQYLVGGYKPVLTKDIRGTIATLDKEFKCYEKIGKKLVLWRGVNGVKVAKNPYMKSLIEKCKALKKGDVLRMSEYAYATKDKEYALTYVHNDGILYEITVPKGSQIATGKYFNFPRSSMFLCTQNKIVKENDKKLHHIKLTYLHDKSYPKAKKQKESFLTKIRDFFNNNYFKSK